MLTHKCRLVKGILEQECDGMTASIDGRILQVQTLRDLETGKRRNVVVLRNRGVRQAGFYFNYCPYCRAKINSEA